MVLDYIHKIEYTLSYEERFKRQSKLFKALMQPARVAILVQLRDGEQCVCHLEAILGYRQAYLSQQLAVLRQVGLVESPCCCK